MDKVLTLGKTTLREMIHERVFLVVVVIAVFLFGLSFLLGALSFDEQKKILTDFGFLGIQIATLGVSLFSGAFLISREIEKQTCLLILSRPVSRDQFMMGKLSGVLALNLMLVVILGGVLAALLGLSQTLQWISFLEICLSLWIESAVILCLVIGASMVVRPVLALSLGLAVFLLGQWIPDLMFFAERSKEPVFIQSVRVFQWVIPNLYRMNWKSLYFLEKGIPGSDILWMLGHMLGWFIVYTLMTNILFRRKDIV